MYSQMAIQLDYLDICYIVLIIGVHQRYPSCSMIPPHFDLMHLNLLNNFDQ